MKLYHGGIAEVKVPRILAPDRIGDFGVGFYTTSSLEQARRFTQSRAARDRKSGGVVSIYEVQDDFLNHSLLKCQAFAKADEAWLDFVLANRRDVNHQHDFDIVAGPVADDQVYASLALYENDLISRKELLARLKTQRLVDQILFHTEKSLLILSFTGSEEIVCRTK
jgi:hypothetical protein